MEKKDKKERKGIGENKKRETKEEKKGRRYETTKWTKENEIFTYHIRIMLHSQCRNCPLLYWRNYNSQNRCS